MEPGRHVVGKGHIPGIGPYIVVLVESRVIHADGTLSDQLAAGDHHQGIGHVAVQVVLGCETGQQFLVRGGQGYLQRVGLRLDHRRFIIGGEMIMYKGDRKDHGHHSEKRKQQQSQLSHLSALLFRPDAISVKWDRFITQ